MTKSQPSTGLLLRNSQLSDAISAAESAFADNNPQSRALFERAQAPMPGGNTRSALHYPPFPLYVAASTGARITDADGHSYLDVLGEFTAGLYGHSDPRIVQAITEIAGSGFSNGAPGVGEITLAEIMCARFSSVEKVRFCNSGTEANLYALTLAKHTTGRKKLLCFSGAYHGGALSFSSAGQPMNVPFDWTICRFNDTDAARRTILNIGAELAAVIVEPMMSNGGCIPASREFLRALRDACDQTGVLLIFDEVVTSRMGSGGMQKLTGILPDLTTFGKYIGAGFSFGAFGGRADLMDHFDPMRPGSLPHAGTFNNNVFSMSAGTVGLRDIFTPERADRLYAEGEALRARLNDLCHRSGVNVQFTGCGSTMNIHFSDKPIACPEDIEHEPKDLFTLFHLDLLEQGVFAARRGQINLSLPMTSADFDLIVAAVAHFLGRRQDVLAVL